MKRFLATTALLMVFTGSTALAQPQDERWVVDPETLSSPYGAEDERGAANLLTPDTVLSALSLVQTGEVLSLGIPLDRDTPAYGWRRFEVIVGTNGGTNYSNNEDIIFGPVNTGTQIDGLAHFGVDGVFFNGNRGEDIQDPAGLTRLGVENTPPIITRGLVLDIPRLKGVERLEIGYVITVEDIQAAMARQGITDIRTGDVVIFHTGHRTLLDEGQRELFLSGQPGPGMEAARWLVERGVVAVGGDSGSMEAVPHEKPGVLYPVHQILLAQNGVHILENIATERLVAGGWSEFAFIAAPLPFVGASSSWINPVAMR
ncbi:MAG: cyclase family protein [Pseudomonadota bacterium]